MVRRWFLRIAEEQNPRELVPEFWEPDAHYYPVRKFPESRPCHGHEEIERFLGMFLGSWERYQHRIKDATAVGDDRVLVHGEIAAEGSASGVALAGDIFHSCWLRNGRFIRMEDHLTERGARDALG